MSDVPSSSNPIQLEATRFRSPVSENLIQQIGGAINGILDLTLRPSLVFTSSGTWTKPANLKWIVVELVGGGGGGAGYIIGNAYRAGAGGGGGGYSRKVIHESLLNPTESVTIGAGGAGGSGVSNGSTGGTTSFGSHCSAAGGTGAISSTGNSGTGGLGLVGDVKIQGDVGSISWVNGNGQTNDTFAGGNGGNSVLGFGGKTINFTQTTGNSGTGYGGGGSGGSKISNVIGAGGNGNPGVVIITEYY